ncbi:MAG TPA: hypothetical protein PLL30_15970 [Candidatus Krumholzibacteria bacterium]|nr:hypothetical protein [Candidatus Krumholzibacteria bacterium]HPD73268.1 hypothetical protein [Candidatus Krumholzibacteria bacterium]HRY40230.1 hypothetical protein [Candidatus Krumholzibacteria bacterium]
MRTLALILLVIVPAWPAAAHDLGTSRPAKPAAQVTPPPPDPEILRQGGDTILTAVPLSIGTSFSGTTAGYTNDYDEICPYTGSTAPDVVYTFTPGFDIPCLYVDMYGSQYDTKIYIYDQSLNLIACNDDFYGDYTSFLGPVLVFAGVQYFLIIDGYGGASGTYSGSIEEWTCGCFVVCPDGAQLENEPEIVDGYVDAWNGGCNSPDFGYPFQPITQPAFCGVTGFYLSASGGSSRDTDWFHIVIPDGGVLEVTGCAEMSTYMFELGPQDCGSVGVVQSIVIWPYDATLTITGPAGSLVWFWVGPTSFWDGDTYEYEYLLLLNLEPVAVERQSWTAIKSLFE